MLFQSILEQFFLISGLINSELIKYVLKNMFQNMEKTIQKSFLKGVKQFSFKMMGAGRHFFKVETADIH